MSSTSAKPQAWRGRRWWGLVGLVLGLQVGLICWLGDREPIRPSPPAPAPTLRVTSAGSVELLALSGSNGAAAAELAALTDPTLFVLPHEQGFAGKAWLRVPPPETNRFEWPETPWSLELQSEQLGAAFQRLVQTNLLDPWETTPRLDPALVLPPRAGPELVVTQSTFRLTGELAERRLVTTLNLRSWDSTDLLTNSIALLTNSIVQLVVDVEGRPVSVTLLGRSGYDEADEDALAQARTARFAPAASATAEKLPGPLVGLSWGELVCQWHTLPPPLTNTSAGPQ